MITIKDFIKTLIIDEKLEISVQTKNKNDEQVEIYNSNKLFCKIDDYLDCKINMIKIDKRKVWLFI